MNALVEENFSGKVLDHLGLVVDKIHELELIELIDQQLPLSSNSKVTMGERVAAMILNGLGFVDTRLYMFPEFFENKPLARLFRRDVKPEFFNDDSLGRCLDVISEFGVTKLFTELSFSIGKKKNLLGKSAHFDTSTLQLWGNYSETEKSSIQNEKAEEAPIPKRGYSKSHRHDLKQMVINLATTGQSAFPIWMEPHSGNASDKKILPDGAVKMNEFCKKLAGSPDFLYVGDSTMYGNILQYSNQLKWVSRVPENILQAKQLIKRPSSTLIWNELSNGYSYHVEQSSYQNVEQRWVLIFSEHAYKKETATLEKSIKKESTELESTWWHLSNDFFSCVEDAKASIKKTLRGIKYHQVNTQIIAINGYSKKGRPGKQDVSKVKGYKIGYEIIQDEEKISLEKNQKGRFILATNQLDTTQLADAEILVEYKAQSGTESGFKFIKDDTFEVDSIFLKTPSRISALMMIMTLCLMVYGVSQYDLRQSLKSTGKTLPNQKRKPTDVPTIKWIYYLFSGVQELTVSAGDKTKTFVINVNAVLKEIIGHFGPLAKAIYLNSSE